jgi:hypothetical protein
MATNETHVQKITDVSDIYMAFKGDKSITWASEGGGPGILDFFGPKYHSLCSLPFQGQKKSTSKSVHPTPYKQQAR